MLWLGYKKWTGEERRKKRERGIEAEGDKRDKVQARNCPHGQLVIQRKAASGNWGSTQITNPICQAADQPQLCVNEAPRNRRGFPHAPRGPECAAETGRGLGRG